MNVDKNEKISRKTIEDTADMAIVGGRQYVWACVVPALIRAVYHRLELACTVAVYNWTHHNSLDNPLPVY